ncbi:MAG: Tmc redox complex protein TmcD [Desulfobacter sp.]|nr:Tmc redox complex protein TmcD [Desulfobacter sp.]WDP86109.1 MAG: Tmc redox complex protein TmcD [Desulfobacter sp.]
MEEKQSWDWSTQLKEIPVKEWESRFNWVEDPCISPDGESVASIVNLDEMAFGICVNSELWEGEYEKAWSLKALPDNRYAVCTCQDEEWGLVVNGQPWANQFDFIWDLKTSSDGSHISVAFQRDMEYGMAVDDQPWETGYENITGMVMGEQGNAAAVVQVDSMTAADVDAFAQGLFSVAVDGNIGKKRFVNIWDISMGGTGPDLAYGVRLDREAYGIAVNESVWDTKFQAVWRPVFCDKSVVAPVRINGKWMLYKDDSPFWASAYENIWRLETDPANGHVAAAVAKTFGEWTIAQNDILWSLSWDTMVRDLYYSQDGAQLVVVFKDKGDWGLAQNDRAWTLSCDKIFTPNISDDGSVVAVCFEKKGKYYTAVNDRVIAGPYDYMADPVISPDMDKILVKGIENGIYKRSIVAL